MDKEQTLALYRQGREAWNEWAKEQLENNDGSEAWRNSSKADFTGHTFDISDTPTMPGGQEIQYSSMPFEAKMLLEPYRRENQDNMVSDLPPFIDFIGFIFPGDAIFANAHFLCDANFGRAEFRGWAAFYGTVFNGSLVFSENVHEALTFNDARFVGRAFFPGLRLQDHNDPLLDRAFTFNDTIFNQDVAFSGSVFPSSRAMFRRAVFGGNADFMEATFNGPALFDRATFKGRAMFYRTTYKASVQFNDAVFEGDTHFHGATFLRKASFNAVQVKSFFRITDANFLEVPDFDQATFAQAPPLDNVTISQRRTRNIWTAAVNALSNGSSGDERCWRALRRLAVQSHDHISEQWFYREELLARRWAKDRCWHTRFWLSLLYQLFSDFGRSPSRPLLWWLSGIIFFATIYLGYYSGTDAWLPYHMETGVWPHTECVNGTGKPWVAALGLSLHNSLPALSGFGDKLAEFYACLYGVDSENSFRPVIPYIVSFLGVPQVLFSTAMIFLFLLAVRNHFKIK